jgi:3-methyladenine DNA glycosylase AlkD
MSPANNDLIADLLDQLAAAADPKRAPRQQAYMKSTLPYYGIAMPELRRITRKVLRSHNIETAAELEATVLSLWDNVSHREEWYAALAICSTTRFRRHLTMEFLGLYRHLIVSGAWWDVVDDIATHLVGPLLVDEPAAMADVLRGWADDDDLWLRRTAIIAQVGAGCATDATLLTDVIEPNLARKEFFLRKAVGWALRDYSRIDPEWVRQYVRSRQQSLSPLSLREACKHLA